MILKAADRSSVEALGTEKQKNNIMLLCMHGISCRSSQKARIEHAFEVCFCCIISTRLLYLNLPGSIPSWSLSPDHPSSSTLNIVASNHLHNGSASGNPAGAAAGDCSRPGRLPRWYRTCGNLHAREPLVEQRMYDLALVYSGLTF
jgi:hypothetical protein